VPRLLFAAVSALAACAVLAGCTSSSKPEVVDVTNTTTITSSTSVSGKEKPLALSTVTPLGPQQSPQSGEIEGVCPYIASTPDQNPTVNVADIEGDHVYRTTVLKKMKPVGCRFYFYAGPYEAIADFTTYRYSSDVTAHNVLVKTVTKDKKAFETAIKGTNLSYAFRAPFFGPDGGNDWACIFQKGTLLVLVRTQQPISFNAVQLAKAIAPKIKA